MFSYNKRTFRQSRSLWNNIPYKTNLLLSVTIWYAQETSENLWLSDDFRGNRDWLFRANSHLFPVHIKWKMPNPNYFHVTVQYRKVYECILEVFLTISEASQSGVKKVTTWFFFFYKGTKSIRKDSIEAKSSY